MSVIARWPGTCSECGGRWEPGELIGSEGRRWAHAACPDVDTTPTHPVCPVCWLTHPEGACDR